jgi:predicted RND superfamily exporter protein
MSKARRSRASAYAEFVLKRRWVFLILPVLLVVAAASGAPKLAFDNDYRVFFSDENPQLAAFEKLQNTYTKIDNVMFAIAPTDGELDANVIAGVEEIVAEAWKLPFVLRVDAITNYQHTVATEDDLVVADLIEGARETPDPDFSAAIDVALNEPALAGKLISRDGGFTGVNVTYQLPGESQTEVPEAVAAARALKERIEAEYPVEVYLTGMVMLNNAFFEASMRDMGTLMPGMMLIIVLVAYLLLRSFSATIGTVFVLLFSVMTGMGLAGHFGIPLTPPSSAAPTIIMTLAVADSIHILMTMIAQMKTNGLEKRAAIVESMRQNFQPVFLTSLTTAVGFLSLLFSDSPPFGHLGLITAMGVVGAFFYSVTFLPAFLSLVPVRPKRSLGEYTGVMDRLAAFVNRNPRRILVGGSAVALLLIALIPLNEVNDDFVSYFAEGTEFRTAIDFTTDNLTGAYQLQYSLESGDDNGIADPEFLAKVGAFTDWLRDQPEVIQVDSVSDTFKRLNKSLHADDPEYYRLPEDRELAAQYLLLYELSLPYGLDLNNQLNVDKSSTHVVATLENLSSRDMREIAQRGEGWLDENLQLSATGIGPAIMFAYISDRNINSMLTGTSVAVVVISLILMLALRSFRIGFLSLVPNLIPAAMAFGLWGLFKGEVNVAVSMVSGMTLGIVVDDTVHFLSKYLRARRENDLSARDAVRYAFTHVGLAITVTTIILVAGFLVLAQSSFAMNSYMASLTAIAIVLAMVTDFLLLPALLLWLDRTDDWNPDEGEAMELKPAAATAGMILLGGALMFSALPAAAQDDAARGLEIATEADRRDTGFGDQEAGLTMILRNRHGEESTRAMRSRTMEVEGDGDMSLVIFDSPGDVKGTAFLSHTHKEGSDDQWLYLPALKRVKRIASSNQSGPFVGSEFAYEDISSQEIEKYTYKFLREEDLDGTACFVIERDPVDPKSGYTRQVVWFDQEHYRVWKIDFYDRGDELLKTLTVSGYNQYLEQYWRADNWKMVNHQTGKSTELIWSDYQFGNDYSDRDFNRNALSKVR